MHIFIKYNKNVWLKRYIDMNTELEKDKNDFEKKIALWIMQFFENHEKYEKAQRYRTFNNWSKKELFSIKTKLAYNNKFFSENLLATKMEKHGYS